MKKVAVIGSGISGMGCALALARQGVEATVFEAADRIGGHVCTVDVAEKKNTPRIDTGFIVYNEETYPEFTALLNTLGVATAPTDMGLSVRDDFSGFEYCRHTLRSVFSQKRNLLSPAFFLMIADAIRFNAQALREAKTRNEETVGSYFLRHTYSSRFLRHYFYPMVAAIWSADQAQIEAMPLSFIARFFENHGFLRFTRPVQWRVIEGGSSRYMEKLEAALPSAVRKSQPVQSITRTQNGVEVRVVGAKAAEHFDYAVLATHSDEALKLLSDASPAEREILGAIKYGFNEAVLHTDTAVLPRNPKAWASWNYLLSKAAPDGLITYHMNTVQNLSHATQYCVSLNPGGLLDPAKVIKRIPYSHPVFDLAALSAQTRKSEISGHRRTYFCGAYWYNGFHEDGLRTALEASQGILDQA